MPQDASTSKATQDTRILPSTSQHTSTSTTDSGCQSLPYPHTNARSISQLGVPDGKKDGTVQRTCCHVSTPLNLQCQINKHYVCNVQRRRERRGERRGKTRCCRRFMTVTRASRRPHGPRAPPPHQSQRRNGGSPANDVTSTARHGDEEGRAAKSRWATQEPRVLTETAAQVRCSVSCRTARARSVRA